MNKKSDFVQNVIVLRSVYGKVGMKYMINPAKDPNTRQYPDSVRRVDSNGDSLIDGKQDKYNKNPRYGIAELYIDMPGVETARRVSKKKLIHQALDYIFSDEQGLEGMLTKCKLLGHRMINAPAADVEDYLVSVAEKDPKKIIDLYTGTDTNLRLLLVDAREKKVIYIKDKLYMYADNIVLGATDTAVITWMKDPKHKKLLDLIIKDTYPEMYSDEPIKSKDKK